MMSTRSRHTLDRRFGRGNIQLGRSSAHEVLETLPKFGDGFVFPRHAEDFFEFAVEIVAGGEEFFEALNGFVFGEGCG